MRKRNITRTVVINKATATVYNRANKEVSEKVYNIIGDYPVSDVETLLREAIKADSLSLVDYVVEQEQVIRSMSEEDFYNASVTITRGKADVE